MSTAIIPDPSIPNLKAIAVTYPFPKNHPIPRIQTNQPITIAPKASSIPRQRLLKRQNPTNWIIWAKARHHQHWNPVNDKVTAENESLDGKYEGELWGLETTYQLAAEVGTRSGKCYQGGCL